MAKKKGPSAFISISIGFLGLLCLILLVSLAFRVFNPRSENEREADDSFLIASVIQVEVLNGCGKSGVASKFTHLLRKSGFDVVETGNYNHYNVEESFILSRVRNKENSLKLARILGIAESNVIIEASNEYFLDATIVLGKDWKRLNTQ